MVILTTYYLVRSEIIKSTTDKKHHWTLSGKAHFTNLQFHFTMIHITIIVLLRPSWLACLSRYFTTMMILRFIYPIQTSYPAECLSLKIWLVSFSSQNSDGKHPGDYSPVQPVMGCWNGDLCKLCWMWPTEFRLHQQDRWDCALLCWRQICISSWTSGSFYGHSV